MRLSPALAALALLCLGLVAQAGLAQAQEPVLTLLFSGNTYGNYAPCPS